MQKIIRIGVLASGSGSNFQSIIDSIESGALNASIAVLITNKSDAFAIERARNHEIPYVFISHQDFSKREDFDRRMIEVLHEYEVDLVVMAGFMRLLSSLFLRAFPHRILNIHPALLPSFPGLHGQEQAFDYGVKFTGCTVHFADEGVDTGPIIIQAVVPVYDHDSAESLKQRILKEEHRIYPQAIQLFAEGCLEIEGRKVKINNQVKVNVEPLHNPPLRGF